MICLREGGKELFLEAALFFAFGFFRILIRCFASCIYPKG
jgi:hypothetical protein